MLKQRQSISQGTFLSAVVLAVFLYTGAVFGTDVVVLKTITPPTIDGSIDTVWDQTWPNQIQHIIGTAPDGC